MPIFIALLRSVNAGGVNTLRSRDFLALLESLGLQEVRTYIQTGNAVFQTSTEDARNLPEKIQAAIVAECGFRPDVIVLTLAELEKAAANNPFAQADDNPKTLHLTFLKAQPVQPDLKGLESTTKDSEAFQLVGKVFYFYAPEGVGRSKAFRKIEKALGVSGTARNWRTVRKLLEMAKGLEEKTS